MKPRDRPAPGVTFTMIKLNPVSIDMVHRRVLIADVPALTEAPDRRCYDAEDLQAAARLIVP